MPKRKFHRNGHNGNRQNITAKDRSFNREEHERESHNCYSYLLNLHSKTAHDACVNDYKKLSYCRRSQPGYAAGFPALEEDDFNCAEIVKRTMADNPYLMASSRDKPCPADMYKGAIVVAPKRDYHYYRLNDEGYWTHKPGYKPSTQYDADDRLILDPETANRKYGELYYSDFCGYVCVPRDYKKKRMKMTRNNQKFVPYNAYKKKTRKRNL